MKSINDKTKKRLAIASCLIISVILIVLIISKLQQKPIEDVVLPDESIETNDIIVEKPVIGRKEDREDEITVTQIESSDTEETDEDVIDNEVTSEDTSNKDGIDKTTVDAVIEQTIQADIEKLKEPTKEQLTDPTQKPSGEKVEKAPEPVEHDKVEKPKETPKSNNEPQGGDINNEGKTYLPGFGWIENSGENQGAVAEDMYENGNKIGNMD